MGESVAKIISTVYDYVEMIWLVVVPVATFFIGKYAGGLKRYKLRRLLGFKRNVDWEVILPTWSGNLEFSAEEAEDFAEKYGRAVRLHHYIRQDEVASLLLMQKLCDAVGGKAKIFLESMSSDHLKNHNNKFFCGGPLANTYLRNIFLKNATGAFSFERRILFGTKRGWYERKKNEAFRELQRLIPDDVDGTVLFVENEDGSFREIPIPSDAGFVFLIRYKPKNHGGFFVAFGNNAMVSMKAVEMLLEDTDEIFALTKKHKQHFFLILKTQANGELHLNNKDNVFDLTDCMFPEKRKNVQGIFKGLFRPKQ